MAFGPWAPKRLARWPGGRARLLLGLADRVEQLQPLAGERRRVDDRAVLAGGLVDQLDEPGEVLLPLARAEVDAEPGGVERPWRRPGPSGRRPSGRRRWRTGCSGSIRPSAGRRRRSRRGRSRWTSAAIRVGNVSASKRVIGPTPLRPSWSDDQVASRSRPTGVTIPMPVTTTRRHRGDPFDRRPRIEPVVIAPRRCQATAGLPRIDQGGGLTVAGEVRLHEGRVGRSAAGAPRTRSSPHSGSGSSQFRTAGIRPRLTPSRLPISSTTPQPGDEVAHVALQGRDRDARRRRRRGGWPGTRRGPSRPSPPPWALTWPTSVGSSPASLSAARMAISVPNPRGRARRRVGRRSPSRSRGLRRRPSPRGQGVLALFEDQDAGPFAGDPAVAADVERLAGRAGSPRQCDIWSSRLIRTRLRGWILESAPPRDHHVGPAPRR